jgi:hypothetical protein
MSFTAVSLDTEQHLASVERMGENTAQTFEEFRRLASSGRALHPNL